MNNRPTHKQSVANIQKAAKEREARIFKETKAKFAEEAASTETISEREARRKVEQRLATAIHEEEEAIADYKRDAVKADPKTKKLFKHIAKQEVHHKEELTNRLKQLR